MNTDPRYLFQGRQYSATALKKLLTDDGGWAAPYAREMDLDELIEALVDQCFMDRRDAPRKVR